jgi:hypothetical protein
MSFRAFVTLLCGCLIVFAAATSTATAQMSPAKVQPCQNSAQTNTCGGICSLGQTCMKMAGSNKCGCQPVIVIDYTCKYNPEKKTCGGTCPKGQGCIKDPVGICSCH